MKNKLTWILSAGVLIIGAFLGTSCGKKSETSVTGDSSDHSSHGHASITITGDDTMRFDTTKFTVAEGDHVILVFKNVGKMAKEVMGHNLIILKPGTDVAAFAMEALKFPENEYLPQDAENQSKIVAATKILGPGEQEVLDFMAGAPGEYPFVCSFPGHFAIMQGVMTVEP